MPIVKLAPAYKDYIWGGTNLKEKYGKKCDLDIVAESWEVSTHPDGPSTVVSGPYQGKTLTEYIDALGKDCLGTKGKEFAFFPMLIKFIDSKQPLSIQVHPDNEYALRVDLGHGIAGGGAHGSSVELEFAGTEIERHSAEYPHEIEILEGPEEPRLGNERGVEAYALGILDDTVGRIDIGEGPVASGIARIVEYPVAGHVRNLEVAVGTEAIGSFVRTGLAGVVVVGLSVDVAQVGIHGGDASLDTLLRFEERRVVGAARLLVEDVRAGGRQ